MKTILICEETFRKTLERFDTGGHAVLELNSDTPEPVRLIIISHNDRHPHLGVIYP